MRDKAIERAFVPEGGDGDVHPARRARDRIVLREWTLGPGLQSRHELQNLLLFVDDDVRETFATLANIERFLLDALAILDRDDVQPEDLRTLAGDGEVLERLDYLSETLQSLRRRLGTLAAEIDE